MEQILYILTGDSGSGKTTALVNFCSSLERQGKSFGGVLAPGVWSDGMKIAIDNVLYPDKTRIRLATRKEKASDGLIKKWDFSDEAIAKVNKHFENLGTLDYTIIDELGPLELIEKKGIYKAVDFLCEKKFNKAIVVIRPSLLDLAKSMFSHNPKVQIIKKETLV